jgi:glycosyltransferase involved in cell wall biosynthesis
MNTTPLVSLLMTAYNREKYIAEAIESVLASVYQNWELIIVDDCSKDKTLEIAKLYESKDNRISVYLNEKNLGDYPNRNHAADYAKGKYIKYLDSDDLIYPHGLQVMIEAMEKFPEAEIGMCFNNYDEKQKLPLLFSAKESVAYHFFYKGLLYIGPSGTVYKRDYFFQIGKFNPLYKVAADYEFNLRAAAQSPTVLFHRDLFWWRQHEEQEISNSNKNNEYIIFNYHIHKTLERYKLDNSLTRKILKNNDILMGRRLLNLFLKGKLKTVFQIIGKTNFPMIYFIRCLLPTEKYKNAEMLK